MGDFVTLEVDDGVGVVRIDRPPANVIDLQLATELREALEEAAGRDDVGALVLWGGQRIFAAGADIKQMVEWGPNEVRPTVDALGGAADLLEAIPKISIAAVNGYALGGGLELALGADLRYLGDDAKVGQPEIRIGVIPASPPPVVVAATSRAELHRPEAEAHVLTGAPWAARSAEEARTRALAPGLGPRKARPAARPGAVKHSDRRAFPGTSARPRRAGKVGTGWEREMHRREEPSTRSRSSGSRKLRNSSRAMLRWAGEMPRISDAFSLRLMASVSRSQSKA